MRVRLFTVYSRLLLLVSLFANANALADLTPCLPKSLSAPPYATKAMLGYQTKIDRTHNVVYLSDSERALTRLRFTQGKPQVVTENGWTGVTTNERMMYVMDAQGSFFVMSAAKGFKHSSFFGGRPIAAAGNLRFENDVLKHIDNGSGHYKPGDRYLKQAIARLAMLGVDISRSTLSFEGNSAVEGFLSVRTPANLVYGNLRSLRCIEKSLAANPVKNVDDLRTFHEANPKRFRRFLGELEKTGKLVDYDSALKKLADESSIFEAFPTRVKVAMNRGYSTDYSTVNRFPCARFLRNLFR